MPNIFSPFVFDTAYYTSEKFQIRSAIGVLKLTEQKDFFDEENCGHFLEITDYLGLPKKDIIAGACYYLSNIPKIEQTEQIRNIALNIIPCIANISEKELKKCIHVDTNTKYINLSNRGLYSLHGIDKLASLLRCEANNCGKNCAHAITSIFLNNNKLNSIDQNLFIYFPNLKIINLAHNNITNLKKNDFSIQQQNYFEDIEIDLSNNNIETIEQGAFKKFFNGTINLSHNKLNQLEIEKIQNFFKLSKMHQLGKKQIP